MGYDNLNRLVSRLYPDSGIELFSYSPRGLFSYTNQLSQTTFYGYDAASRKLAETNANAETNGYSFSPAGDLLTLTDGKGQTTTWTYDIYGLVSNKVDAASNLILQYHYDANYRLTNRWSAAKGNTYYYYDCVGNLTNITYPVNPAISIAYDALNRPTNMVDAVGTTSYGYDAVGQLLSEDGPWASDTVAYGYTARMRTSLSLQQPNADPWNQTYGYDGARRLTSTASPAGSFGYTYDSNRKMLVSDLSLPNTANITNAYDANARLLGTALVNSGGTNLDAYTYTYNVGNQRTTVTRTLGDVVSYGYDGISQLTSASAKELGGVTNRLQEQFDYAYDAAHNLESRTNNASIQTFNVNSLNELTTVTRNSTNALTVAGTTGAKASMVTVNGLTASNYNDATFAEGGFTPVDGNNTYTAIAADALGRHSTNAVTVFLPASASYTYDLNGNLLSDGTRTFNYDDENQLTNVWVTNAWMSQFVYDGRLRRRTRKEFAWQGGAWVETNEVHYVYDGNLVIQERDINNLPLTTYTRGNDLSGSLQGAGGIGGLLAMSQPSTVNPQQYYYHADGNGKITALVNNLQTVAAKYLYDPYGNLLSLSGPLANANLYRFSSKEYHQNAGLVYYLYRFYDPNLQRWLNRDPIGEAGGINLYQFAGNNPINFVDPYGLAIGDWWDARTYFNSGFTESWSDSANSIGQALGGALAGNWDQVANAYDTGVFGQTQDADPFTYYGTRAAVGTAAAATAVASAALASEGLASSGCYRVGARVAQRAASPFLRNTGSRWFSQMQTDALLQTGRLGNYAGETPLLNWLTTFRYAQAGGGEAVYNWVTGTIIHANPFF